MRARRISRLGQGIIISAVIFWACAFGNGYAGASYGTVHNFTDSEGSYPQGGPIISGSTIYGMASEGGANNLGTIFKVNTDGTGFQRLHSFSGADGVNPVGNLTLSGSTLYGLTPEGGTNNFGTVFKINTDGSGFQVLYNFGGVSVDGDLPMGTLTLVDSTLYGMTLEGGVDELGMIFRIDTDGSNFGIVHSFNDVDGAYPEDSLVHSGNTLYGATRWGGAYGNGAVFRVNTDGAEYTVLHDFSMSVDAYMPSTPTLVGSTLYGVTEWGGTSDAGIIYKIDTDGENFQILHNFSDDSQPWIFPKGPLAQIGSALYGMTQQGGTNDRGTIFTINTDGAGFRTLHNFWTSSDDGIFPYGSLAVSESRLYGMTSNGPAGFSGMLFWMDAPAPPGASSIPIFQLLLLDH
ncbi:MAG: choice-of-anchor tandem repeat GloVer-containing protein [Syntrophobacteraceae bacterium]